MPFIHMRKEVMACGTMLLIGVQPFKLCLSKKGTACVCLQTKTMLSLICQRFQPRFKLAGFLSLLVVYL